MIAVGPLALVDMAFIAWRNLRLIQPNCHACTALSSGITAVCDCFAWCRWNIAFAGAQRTGARGGDGLDVAGSGGPAVGARAQGIGAGLLTARLGIKAMELCRPLPWIADDKPRLGDFRRELIGQLERDPAEKQNQSGSNLCSETLPGGGLPCPAYGQVGSRLAQAFI